MKPAAFGYSRPESLPEALTALAQLGSEGKVLAGGQSLLPLLSMRLASVGHLVDINRLAELDYVRTGPDGVRIGAIARHSAVEHDVAAAHSQPLLRSAVQLVAHPTIRNRGTAVGSIVHADPSGELPAVLHVLGGSVRLASVSGIRDVAAADFFLGPLEADVRPGELAVEVFVPAARPGVSTAFVEVARRHGDYAVCGVAVTVQRAGDGAVTEVRAGYISVAGVPLVVDLSDAISGGSIDEAVLADLVRDSVDPDGDIHATADYRRKLASVLTVRAVRQAVPMGIAA